LDDAGDVLRRRVDEAFLSVELYKYVCLTEEQVHAYNVLDFKWLVDEFVFFSRFGLDEYEGFHGWAIGLSWSIVS
jgi:hypothetical protein